MLYGCSGDCLVTKLFVSPRYHPPCHEMAESNGTAKNPRKTAVLFFLSTFLVSYLAFKGYRDLGTHGDGNVVALAFEVILPAMLAVAFLWYGVVYWRKGGHAG